MFFCVAFADRPACCVGATKATRLKFQDGFRLVLAGRTVAAPVPLR